MVVPSAYHAITMTISEPTSTTPTTVWVSVSGGCSRPAGGDTIFCPTPSRSAKSKSPATPSTLEDDMSSLGAPTVTVAASTTTVGANATSIPDDTTTTFSYSPTTTDLALTPAGTSTTSSAAGLISNTSKSSNGVHGAVAAGVMGALALLSLLFILFAFATGRLRWSKRQGNSAPSPAGDGATRLGPLLLMLPWKNQSKDYENREGKTHRLKRMFHLSPRTGPMAGLREPRQASELPSDRGPYAPDNPYGHQAYPDPRLPRTSADTYPVRAFNYDTNNWVPTPPQGPVIPPRSVLRGDHYAPPIVSPPQPNRASVDSTQPLRTSSNATSEEDRAMEAAAEIEGWLSRPHYTPNQGMLEQRWDPAEKGEDKP